MCEKTSIGRSLSHTDSIGFPYNCFLDKFTRTLEGTVFIGLYHVQLIWYDQHRWWRGIIIVAFK